MRYISKIAAEESNASKILSVVIPVVWKKDAGLFENIIPLSTYVVTLSSAAAIPLTLAAAFGSYILGKKFDIQASPHSIGAWLDEMAGTGPGQYPSPEQIRDRLEKSFNEGLSDKKSKASNQITKEANIWSALLKSGNLGTHLAKGLYKLIKVAMGLFGVRYLEDMFHKANSYIDGSAGTEELQEENKQPDDFDEVDTLLSETKQTDETKSPDKNKGIDSLLDEMEKKYNL